MNELVGEVSAKHFSKTTVPRTLSRWKKNLHDGYGRISKGRSHISVQHQATLVEESLRYYIALDC